MAETQLLEYLDSSKENIMDSILEEIKKMNEKYEDINKKIDLYCEKHKKKTRSYF